MIPQSIATGAQAPEWIRILPLGQVELRDNRGVLRCRFKPSSFKIIEKRVGRIAKKVRKDLEKIIIKILKETTTDK
jgi:hypothetical protein